MAEARWARRRPGRAAPRELDDHEVLTQYGQEKPDTQAFRGQPRFPDETDLSMIIGTCTVEEAVRLVTGRDITRHHDIVRHFSVGDLRAAGYAVHHTPTIRNPYHVSVTAPDGSNAESWWAEQGEPMLELHVLDGRHRGKTGSDNE